MAWGASPSFMISKTACITKALGGGGMAPPPRTWTHDVGGLPFFHGGLNARVWPWAPVRPRRLAR